MADLSILVKILAQNNASGALRAVRGDLEHMGVAGAKSGGILGTVGGIAAGAAIGGIAALGGALAYSVKQAADFESVISGVGAVSGATGEQMGALSSAALQIGKDTKFTATEAAQAMEELVKAGISVEDILNGAAGAAVNLAAAGATSIPNAAAIMAGAMNAFNIAGTDAAHVADIITGAANASTISVEEFGIGFGQMAAVANLTGFSLEDSATALALVTKAGISASDAGTSLKTMFLQLNPQTAKARSLMAELGIITADGRNQFFNAKGEVRSLAEVSQVLTDALTDLTDEDRILALKQLFGQDAVRAGAILFQKGAEGVRAMKDELENTDAAEVARMRMDNLAGSLEKMWGSISTAAVTLGLALTPALKVAADGFTDMINQVIPWVELHGPAIAESAMGMVRAFIPWVQEHAPAIIQGFKDFATTAFGVAGAIIEVIGKVNELLTPLGGLGTALPIVVGMMGVSGLLGAVSGLLGPLGFLAGGLWGLLAPLAPIALAMWPVLAVAGLLAISFLSLQEILNNFSWANFQQGLMNVHQWIKDVTAAVFGLAGVQVTPTNPQQGPVGEIGEGPSEDEGAGLPPVFPFPSEGPSEDDAFHTGGVVPGVGNRVIVAQGGEIVARPIETPVVMGGGGISFGGINISVGATNIEELKREIIEQFTQELDIAFEIARSMGTSTPIALQNRT